MDAIDCIGSAEDVRDHYLNRGDAELWVLRVSRTAAKDADASS